MYDAFYTQTPLGILEFSDLPLSHHIPKDEQHHGFFAAKHVTRYLEDYVRGHSYESKTLLERIILGASVKDLSKQNEHWRAEIEDQGFAYLAKKVIDCTGLTSHPAYPAFAGKQFSGRELHHKDFGQSNVLSDPSINRIVVIGGAKSAADVAYACAKAGKKVSWIIRKSGAGPAAFVAAKGQGPYRNSNESFYTRITGYFLCSTFIKDNWLTGFLYRTSTGNTVFRKMWQRINHKSHVLADYDRKDGQENGFFNLKPDTDIFWANDSPSINQREDFFNIIASRVQVHREDIDRAEEHSLMLTSGVSVHADAIIYATGWLPTHLHIEDSLAMDLGLPVSSPREAAADSKHWETLLAQADKQVLKRFPLLGQCPADHEHPRKMSSFKLYKSIVPLRDHSIVFLGKMMLGNHFRNAEVQALYAIAVLDGTLKLPPLNVMEQEIATTQAWCSRRYLAKGELGSWFYFDMVPYTDMLLEHLGLVSHRKNGWKDLLEPCWAADLEGLVEEYKSKYDSAMQLEADGTTSGVETKTVEQFD